MALTTERLLLRPFRETDHEDLYEFLSQLEKDEFEGYPDITRENSLKHLKQRVGSEEFYAVVLKETGKVIGNIYCGNRDYDAKEVGYIINQRYQHCGYAAVREQADAVICKKNEALAKASQTIGKTPPIRRQRGTESNRSHGNSLHSAVIKQKGTQVRCRFLMGPLHTGNGFLNDLDHLLHGTLPFMNVLHIQYLISSVHMQCFCPVAVHFKNFLPRFEAARQCGPCPEPENML